MAAAVIDQPLETGPHGAPRRSAVKRREDPSPGFADLDGVAEAILVGTGMKGSAPPVPGE